MDSCIEAGLGGKKFNFKDKDEMFSVKGTSLKTMLCTGGLITIVLLVGVFALNNKAGLYKRVVQATAHNSIVRRFTQGARIQKARLIDDKVNRRMLRDLKNMKFAFTRETKRFRRALRAKAKDGACGGDEIMLIESEFQNVEDTMTHSLGQFRNNLKRYVKMKKQQIDGIASSSEKGLKKDIEAQRRADLDGSDDDDDDGQAQFQLVKLFFKDLQEHLLKDVAFHFTDPKSIENGGDGTFDDIEDLMDKYEETGSSNETIIVEMKVKMNAFMNNMEEGKSQKLSVNERRIPKDSSLIKEKWEDAKKTSLFAHHIRKSMHNFQDLVMKHAQAEQLKKATWDALDAIEKEASAGQLTEELLSLISDLGQDKKNGEEEEMPPEQANQEQLDRAAVKKAQTQG